MIRALRRRFDSVDVLANRKFGELCATLPFALDDADLAPFFVKNGALPQRWRDLFSRQELVVSYLHDPKKVFEENVRRCGAQMIVTGPHRLNDSAHATEQLARALVQVGIPILDPEPRLEFVSVQAETSSAIALHPGSGSLRKNWPIENWISLTDRLLADGRRICIVGGEADEKEVARLHARFGENVQYAIDWPLRNLAGFLAGKIFLGQDSGISHLAAAAGARCLLLFGPMDPKVWAPRNRCVHVLVAPGGDLSQLTVRRVTDALGESSKTASC